MSSEFLQSLSPATRLAISEMGKTRVKTLDLRDNAWFTDAVGSFVIGAS